MGRDGAAYILSMLYGVIIGWGLGLGLGVEIVPRGVSIQFSVVVTPENYAL